MKNTYWFLKGVLQSNLHFFFLDRMLNTDMLDKAKVLNEELFELNFDLGNNQFLIGTKGQGLLLIKNNKVYQLIEGVDVYGLTKDRNNNWYAFITDYKLFGSIIKFNLSDNGVITNISELIHGLSKGIHQIDFISDKDMVVTDTYHNRVLIYDITKLDKKNNWSSFTKSIYPNGKLSFFMGRKSDNYNHFNSIFKKNDNIYLIAHNETSKTKKSSQLFKLNNKFETIHVNDIKAENAHNYYFDDNNEMYFNSLNNLFYINNKEVDLKGFTRGLSVVKDYLLCGSSGIEKDRSKRGESGSTIFRLGLDGEILNDFKINRCQIQEIRGVNIKDFSLSEN